MIARIEAREAAEKLKAEQDAKANSTQAVSKSSATAP